MIIKEDLCFWLLQCMMKMIKCSSALLLIKQDINLKPLNVLTVSYETCWVFYSQTTCHQNLPDVWGSDWRKDNSECIWVCACDEERHKETVSSHNPLTSACSAVFLWPSLKQRDTRQKREDQIIIITYRDKQIATSLFLTQSFFPTPSLPTFTPSVLPHPASSISPSSHLSLRLPPLAPPSLLAPIEWIVIMSGVSSALCTSLLY